MGTDYTTYRPSRVDCGTTTGEIRAYPASRRLTPVVDPLTDRTMAIWSAGDYDRIAAGFRHEGQAFIARLRIAKGTEVLDAACGSGNLTIPAARAGAKVTGFDLVPSLLDHAAAWALREGLSISLDQGTVEKLPYANARFDIVTSMFGVMFAARPDRVVAELARVTRTGGRVVLANWTRDGFVGKLLAAHVAYVPPPAGLPSPLQWGDENTIRQRFDHRDWQVSTRLRTLTFRYPTPPIATAGLFCGAYGPTVRTLAALDADRRLQMAGDLADLWKGHQRPGATGTEVESEYLEVSAIRR